MSSTLSRNYRKNTGSILGLAFRGYLFVLITIFGIAVFVIPPNEESPKNRRTDITYMTPKEYQERINDIKVIPWVGGGADDFSSSTNETEKSKSHTYVADKDFVLKDMDSSKLTATQIEMIREFVRIINDACDETNVEPWVLCGELMSENSLAQLGESGIYLPVLGFDFSHYGKSWKNGKVINFTNMNRQMYIDEGHNTAPTWDDGPFQFTGNNWPFDKCSLVDSAKAAGKRFFGNDFGGIMRDYLKSYTSNETVLQAFMCAAHNTGPAGMKYRIPKDARADAVKLFEGILNDEGIASFGESVIKSGHGPTENREVFKLFDKHGNFTYSTEAYNQSKNAGYTPKNPPKDLSILRYRGNGSGERISSGFINSQNNRLDGSRYGKKYVYCGDVNDPEMIFSYIEARYIIASYAGGKTLWNSLNQALSEVDSNSRTSGGQRGLSYIWQTLSGISPTAINYSDTRIQGAFGQVGYKGMFPLFVQGAGMNDISNLPWKFNGSPTTLGSSGCSMFALMSLIHGVGYGDLPLPNKDLPNDGLNEEGYICFEKLSQILTNGPLLSDDANYLGYRTKTVPTDRAGLEELYDYLKQGIPFIVNVRYGDVGGYDADGQKHIVHFTNSGHFMIFSGAYEADGKRYVEVVQSTYSNAGTAKNDENALVFDYDELIEKEIIRSSFGSCVPAYTIIGREDNLREPIYMNSTYQVKEDLPPTEKDISNNDQQAIESINHLIDTISEVKYILLPKNMYIGLGKDYVDLYITDSDFLRVTGITFYSEIKESGYYNKNEYIGITKEDTTFTRYHLNEDGSAEIVELK